MTSHDFALSLREDPADRDDTEALTDLAETIAEQRGDAARDDAVEAGRPLTRLHRETPARPQDAHAPGRPAVTLTDRDADRLIAAIRRDDPQTTPERTTS